MSQNGKQGNNSGNQEAGKRVSGAIIVLPLANVAVFMWEPLIFSTCTQFKIHKSIKPDTSVG